MNWQDIWLSAGVALGFILVYALAIDWGRRFAEQVVERWEERKL
jgi:hypothetical protein